MLSGRVPFEGNCGENCGWEQGKHCDQCQSLLLGRIQAGNYNFSGKVWSVFVFYVLNSVNKNINIF